MCLILFAWQSHPQYKLVVAANRDEFYARSSAPAHFWQDAPNILAGRDLEQGGTWLGVTRNARFAAITNVRDPSAPEGTHSRGHLVRDFLSSNQSPAQFITQLQNHLADYSPFNLLLGDGNALHYCNSNGENFALQAGIYGLSNAALDTPWPKVEAGKQALTETLSDLEHESLFCLLADKTIASDDQLPNTGIPQWLEQKLSASFIHFDNYGTRCSSLVLQTHDHQTHFFERQFNEQGTAIATQTFQL
ncbi:MAG: NRDE family protein [Pseudomonadales bacterium]